MIKYFVSILSLIQICLAAETITIGCNIEDFSFIEKCSGNPKMLYQISGLRSFPGLDGGNIQTIDHTKMLVGARKDYTTPHNSGFVWDGWLVGGKKHIIQIETASSRDQSVMLYIGYGHKPLEDRVLQEWSEDYFLFFKHRKLTLKSYLGQGYDKHFWQVPLLFPKSQTVTEYEFIAPTSHEKGNTLVPIHIGCAFTNDSLPLKDFFTITNFKVLYFDSMDSIQYLSNQASLNIHHG
ncbi:MAG TPA: hypothetical protein VNJ29_02480, partial [Candidatus Nitrosotenuis sp.]|nr:hypothetical protein [Candidatus Nitrosotenuis sp.]